MHTMVVNGEEMGLVGPNQLACIGLGMVAPLLSATLHLERMYFDVAGASVLANDAGCRDLQLSQSQSLTA